MNGWSMPIYTPRPAQIRILDECCDALNEGYKNILVNAGTGIGKSAIAMTLAQGFPRAYILTNTTQLQNQYKTVFNDYLCEIKGRRHYQCINNPNTSCDNGTCRYVNKFNKCPECQYNTAKEEAKKHSRVLTNYHYIYSVFNQFKGRDVCIFDEAHNLENILLQLTSEIIEADTLRDDLNIELPYYTKPTMYLEDLEEWSNKYGELKEKETIPKWRDLYEYKNWKYKWLNHNINDNDWIVQHLPGDKIVFKSLYPAKYDKQLMKTGRTRIFLTATIGSFSRWCEYNNLDEDEVYYIYEKSPFPVENRPIIRKYVGKLNYEFWQSKQKVKQLCTIIQGIINMYPDDKCVIHCTSHYQATLLKNSSLRCITFPEMGERDEFIKEFIDSEKPVVFVSPSLKYGVDLRDDACRFQIIVNIPNPNMGDEQIYKRVREYGDWDWYFYQTCMELQQAYGRGVRHEEDYCTCYILDKRFDKLLKDHNDLFDEYFLEAII